MGLESNPSLRSSLAQPEEVKIPSSTIKHLRRKGGWALMRDLIVSDMGIYRHQLSLIKRWGPTDKTPKQESDDTSGAVFVTALDRSSNRSRIVNGLQR